jgi:hypothetical protein
MPTAPTDPVTATRPSESVARATSEVRTSRNQGAAVIGVDDDTVHAAEVDDEAGAQRAAGLIVPAAAHRQGKTGIACRSNGQLGVFGRPVVNDSTRHAAHRLRPDCGRGNVAVLAGIDTRPDNCPPSRRSVRSI